LQHLPEATDVKFADPSRPGGDTEGFTRVYRREQAAAQGISYEEFSGDYSKSNFASSRASQQNTNMTFSDWIDEVDEQLISPIYRDFIDQIYYVHGLRKVPQAADIYAHFVQHPKPGWVNPLQEVKAEIEAINMRLMSRTSVCASHGLDFYEVAEQTADEESFIKLLLDSHGLDDPTKQDNTEGINPNG